MIKTFKDLLQDLKEKGIQEIEQYLNIGHNPTIGDMYEGLTKELMEKSIFEGLELSVVSGKIINDDGVLSRQIDCMIVVGDGEKLPYTDSYIYNINNVIAVIEVKKKLFSKELQSAHENLNSVARIEKYDKELEFKMFQDAFRSISGMNLPPRNLVGTLSEHHQMLYHILIVECILPIRVIFGYEGFSTEKSLRDNFFKYIEEQSTYNAINSGLAAHLLPNLIISNENSLVKTNGMPYTLITNENDSYCWMASYRKNPLLIFLELLWTRLTYHYNISSSVFGEDLEIESLAPLLLAKGTKTGWTYELIDYSEEELNKFREYVQWEPKKISSDECKLLALLHEYGNLTNNKELIESLKLSNKQMNDILEKLIKKRLICCESNNIKLLTKKCRVVCMPDGTYYAADDFDGRFTNWLSKYNKQ
jgi:hypothetical protein